MTRDSLPGIAAVLLSVSLAACSDSAPEIIELTYRDRCPATDKPVSLISMDDLARLSGAKLLTPEQGSPPILIRVNAPPSLAAGTGIRLDSTSRDGSVAVTRFVVTEAKTASGNACSILTIAPDATGYEVVSAFIDGKPIGSVTLAPDRLSER